MSTIYELFKIDPKLALEEMFVREFKKSWMKDRIFVWQCTLGTCRKTRYGSYRYVTREELSKRSYKIEYWDSGLSIAWTDTLFEPRGCQHILKSELKCTTPISCDTINKVVVEKLPS